MRANSIVDVIGNTPHIRINRLFGNDYEVWIKLEKQNPGGSIKDRVALSMIRDAEAKGILTKDSIIVEPTSGNTGIGLALVGAALGYKVVLVMPESMSVERRAIMSAYGAEFVLTSREKGMKGAIERANEMAAQNSKVWIPMQFDNPANIRAHEEATALEIIADFPEGIDYIITGVGTGGHITGVARVLKKKWPALKVLAVEPVNSPVISGGQPSPHPLQGIGAGFIPKNLDTSLLDGVIKVDGNDAFDFVRRAASQEGLFVGISSGASLSAINQKLYEIAKGARILTFNYDTGERYLSVPNLFLSNEDGTL